jgi:hypothetical protein
MKIYAQLNEDNVCVGVSNLTGEVSEYNYIDETDYNPITGESTSKQVFVSRMIEIPVYSVNFIGLQYTENGWTKVIDNA